MGARWLLLGAVIAGVLAMHILNAADSSGDHRPMAMTPAGANTAASSTSMAMDMSAVAFQVPTAHPGTVTKLSAVAGVGMSPMPCCVLLLISTVTLVLLMHSHNVRTAAAADQALSRAAPTAGPQRGPPGPGRPRIALSIQRVLEGNHAEPCLLLGSTPSALLFFTPLSQGVPS